MIEIEDHSGIATVRLAHGKANALDVEFCRALRERFVELGRARPRAVVLAGGATIFSAGVDLTRFLDGGPDYADVFLPALCDAFEVLFFFPHPVVAAIGGHAVAGGCILACTADRRLMARDAGRIGVPELPVGVPFPTIALEILRFAVAPRQLEELVYHGGTYPPEEGLRRGLVDEVVERPELMERARAAAEALAERDPELFSITKGQIRQPVRERLHLEQNRHEAAVRRRWRSQETREAIRAYVERTLRK